MKWTTSKANKEVKTARAELLSKTVSDDLLVQISGGVALLSSCHPKQ